MNFIIKKSRYEFLSTHFIIKRSRYEFSPMNVIIKTSTPEFVFIIKNSSLCNVTNLA